MPFAQAAFRQAFAGGRSLQDPDYVLIAAAACEMHPAAVLRGGRACAASREQLERRTAAGGAGRRRLACRRCVVGGAVFHGEGALEQAREHMLAEARR